MKRTPWGESLALAGLGALIIGGVGLLARPSATATPTADIGTPVAIIPPHVLALDGLESITVTGESLFEIREARPADAYAWATGAPTTVVRGLSTWEEVDLDTHSVTGAIPELPGDLWRDWDFGYLTEVLDPSAVEPGAALVIYSGYDAPLGDITLTLTRDRGNTWAWPVLALGFGLVAMGLLLLSAALIDFHPFQRAARRRDAAAARDLSPTMELAPKPPSKQAAEATAAPKPPSKQAAEAKPTTKPRAPRAPKGGTT